MRLLLQRICQVVGSLLAVYVGLWYGLNADTEVTTVMTVDRGYLWGDIALWVGTLLMVLLLIGLWHHLPYLNWLAGLAIAVSIWIWQAMGGLSIFIPFIVVLAILVWTVDYLRKRREVND